MTASITICILLSLCLVDTSQVYDTKAAQPKVILKPPKIFSVDLKATQDVYFQWLAPDVYPLHKVNDSFNEESKSDVLYWTKLNETKSTSSVSVAPSTTPASKASPTNATTDVNSANPPAKSTTAPLLLKPKCLSDDKFAEVDHLEVFLNTIDHAVVGAGEKYGSKDAESNGTHIAVNFDEGCVEMYIVYFINNKTGETIEKEVPYNQTEYHMSKLTNGTTYSIIVSAVFTSGHALNSTAEYITTNSFNSDQTVCQCSQFGSVPGATCDVTQTIWCTCKSQYTGAFCEQCRPGYYRSAPYFPCNRCPCSPLATYKSTCFYREGFLVCDSCKPHYTGHLCQSCINGFYRYHGRCIPCSCNGNADTTVPRMCDPYTGACTKCTSNTTGMNCERCIPGYARSNPQDRHCVREKYVGAELQAGPSKGLIAAICVFVILAICAVVGFIVYRRWRLFPPRKPFWTVELKEDHDSINFSAIPGQEYTQHNAADVQDLDFYEKHRGKSSGRSVSNYSPLREEL